MNIKELFSNFNDKDYFSTVNLHIHSNNSDGECDFDDLIEQAQKLGLKYISITDHNCVKGYKTSKYKDNPPENLTIIKGVEFDCFYKMSLLHILGYGIDIDNPKINALCAKNEQEQKNDIIRLFKSRHPKHVIDAIHSAGGIAILAHPCCSTVINLDNYVKCLIKLGLDGLETHYLYDRFRSVVKFSSKKLPFKIAKKYNLIQTGGLDEHHELKIIHWN